MISVIIPVLNECDTIHNLVQRIRLSNLVTEVIVVDDGSVDGTPELAAAAGARVVTSSLLGKGASMADGALAATTEYLLYMDGDLSEFADDLVQRMMRPLLANRSDFVKAKFSRTLGRVTQLSAKPLLQTFFPELLGIDQPLGGIVATRKSLIASVVLENDYGVDIGLLLDMHQAGVRIEQVDIGYLEHDSQPLENLGRMANQVVRTILNRAQRSGRLNESQLLSVREYERRTSGDLQQILFRLGSPQKFALLDMDGTLIRGRFVETLARATEQYYRLGELLDNDRIPPEDRTAQIASLFAGVPQSVFQDVAMKLPLVKGAVELVIGLKKRGYSVGIVSDSFLIATEIIRRRVFAEFSLAHMLEFQSDIATGSVTMAPSMKHPRGCPQHSVCKRNVLQHLGDYCTAPPSVLAVGDNDGDACMLRNADWGFAFEPKSRQVAQSADFVVHGNIANLLHRLDSAATQFSSRLMLG